MAPLLFAFFGIMIVKCRLYQVFLFWLPMYLSGNICMRRFSRNIRTTKWTDIYETTLAPWLLPTVLAAGIGRKRSIFRVTDKSTETKNNSAFYYTLPYLGGIALSIIGIIRLVGLSGKEQTFTYCVILFWLFLNLYFMVMAFYVAAGRKVKTDYLMQNIQTDAIFVSETDRYMAKGKAFSDRYILTEIPEYFLQGSILLKETGITLPLKAGIVQKSATGKLYLYEIDWEHVSEDIRHNYMEFLYNRTPVLPQELKRKVIWDECITTLISRLINE